MARTFIRRQHPTHGAGNDAASISNTSHLLLCGTRFVQRPRQSRKEYKISKCHQRMNAQKHISHPPNHVLAIVTVKCLSTLHLLKRSSPPASLHVSNLFCRTYPYHTQHDLCNASSPTPCSVAFRGDDTYLEKPYSAGSPTQQ